MLLPPRKTYSECNVCNQQKKLLGEKLDWLTVDHDDLRQDLLEQLATPKYHPSMSVIDKWEQETIARIQQTAILARRTLIDALDQHVLDAKKTLNKLTPILREARNNSKSFNENDIQQWATMLHELKQMPVFPVTMNKENNIHGLTIDLRKEKRTHHSEPNRDESTSFTLLSILRDSIILPSTTSDTTENKIVSINVTKKIDKENKNVNFYDNILSNRSHTTITPGGVTIIREQEKDESVQNAYAEISFDSRTKYSLRGPATIYH